MQQDSVGWWWWWWWNHKKFFLSKYKCLQICTSSVMGRKLHVHLHILLPTYISLYFFCSIFCFSSLSWSGKCWTKLQQTVTIQPKFASSLTVINADTWIAISFLNAHLIHDVMIFLLCSHFNRDLLVQCSHLNHDVIIFLLCSHLNHHLTLESWLAACALESWSLALESWSLVSCPTGILPLSILVQVGSTVSNSSHKMGSISSLLAGWSFLPGIHEEYFQGSQRMESNSLSQHRNTTAAASGFGRHLEEGKFSKDAQKHKPWLWRETTAHILQRNGSHYPFVWVKKVQLSPPHVYSSIATSCLLIKGGIWEVFVSTSLPRSLIYMTSLTSFIATYDSLRRKLRCSCKCVPPLNQIAELIVVIQTS